MYLKNKVDYIISYCDYSQKEIQELYRKVTGKAYEEKINSNYIDITLTLRLILKNLPFINKLWITCKDVQKLPEDTLKLIEESNGRIARVNESEFMPNNYISFSSACIELFMYRIPGLSELFIYGNDDMIPIRELTIDNFFEGTIPKMAFNFREVPFGCLYDLHQLNATNLVFDRVHNNDNYKLAWYSEHTLRPITKSICSECYQKYENFIVASLYPVRFFNNMNMDLYLIYGKQTGMVMDVHNSYKFMYRSVGSNRWLFDYNERSLRDMCDVICVNDSCSVTPKQKEETAVLLKKLMLRILSGKDNEKSGRTTKPTYHVSSGSTISIKPVVRPFYGIQKQGRKHIVRKS